MILIDTEMPEKCGLCPLFHAEHPMYCQGVKADRKKKIFAPYGQPRPDWCPLHEVDDMPTVETERIGILQRCQPVGIGIMRWKCSECGEVYEKPVNYCSHCGFKLIRQR